jgi:hypothetical protein
MCQNDIFLLVIRSDNLSTISPHVFSVSAIDTTIFFHDDIFSIDGITLLVLLKKDKFDKIEHFD